MAIRTKEQLISDLNALIRSGGQGGKTTAADLRTLLGNVVESLFSALTGKAEKADRGAPNGYASLDGQAKVPMSQMPGGLQTLIDAKQANLGFQPVQQGGGVNQGNNKVYLGWANGPDGNGNYRLKATVDVTDIGNIVMDADLQGALNGKANSNHGHNEIFTLDTRSTNQNPAIYKFKLLPEFKFASAIGLASNQQYVGLLTYAPWDGTSVGGGNGNYQLAFNGQSVHFRTGIDTTWGQWNRFLMAGESTEVNTPNTIVRRDQSGSFRGSWIGATAGLELASTFGMNGLFVGNGDAATRQTHNMFLKGWNGMAFKTYDDSVTGVLDFRAGSLDMNGWITARNFVNDISTGEKSFKFNSGGEPLGFGMYGNANNLGFYDWTKNHSYLYFDRVYKQAYFGGGINAPFGAFNGEVSSNGSFISQSSHAFVSKVSGYKSWVMHHPNSNTLVFAPSGSVNGTDWNWAGDITFSEGGNITAKGNVTATSDARVKTNVQAFSGGLEKVLALRPVTYDRIDTEAKGEIGFLAQEVREIEPSLVREDELLSLDYARMVVLLTQAVQEQQTLIKGLREELNALKGGN